MAEKGGWELRLVVGHVGVWGRLMGETEVVEGL